MFIEDLRSTFVSEYLSGASIDLVDYHLYLPFCNVIKIGSLGEVPSDHSIAILITSSFPRVVGTSKVDGDTQDFRKLGMPGKFTSIIESKCLPSG